MHTTAEKVIWLIPVAANPQGLPNHDRVPGDGFNKARKINNSGTAKMRMKRRGASNGEEEEEQTKRKLQKILFVPPEEDEL
jgi:hypothetical protein